MTHGEKYKYTVRANDGNYHYSSFATYSSVVAANLIPSGKPTAAGYEVKEGNKVVLNWSGTKYDVRIAEVTYTGLVYVPNKVLVSRTANYGSYTVTGLEYNTSYTLGVSYVNDNGNSDWAVYNVTTGSKPSGGGDSGGGSGDGGSGGSGDSGGSSDAITNISTAGMYISSLSTSEGFFDRNVIVDAYGFASWYKGDSYNSTDKKKVKLYRNGTLVGTKTSSGNRITFTKVKVNYGKKNKFVAKLYVTIGGKDYLCATKTCTVTPKLGKNHVNATRISGSQAIVRWSGVTGATGYQIYKGSKLVKTVKKSVWKTTVKKSGIGKAKVKVIPILKHSGKTYKGTSNAVKPKKNSYSSYSSTDPSSYPYATAKFIVKKVTLSGSTYTVTGYAVNNRIFDLWKYKKLKITGYADGKKVFSKTYKNKKCKIKGTGKKKLVFKIKGKKAQDLANGNFHWSVDASPYWEHGL